ncbi:MAG TPA: HEXXH motif-containing putative peptide modification protein [Umezawaea sp.]|nr:HEXXH motif-containing putative peptide modification protein [Umezawaea sp.]
MALDLVAVHAAFARPDEIVAERRALYRLAAELVGARAVPDAVLDSPLVRYRLGGALAGQVDLGGRDLAVDRDAIGQVVDAGLPVVADPVARDALADLLRIVGPVLGLRLMAEDDEGFDEVLALVAEGVRLAREAGGALAEDLLTHVDLLAVVDPATAGGLVSASSRYVPGVVVVVRPRTAFEVAEALIHEGAHEKFFDLAITRSFLDVNSDAVEEFTPSWSGARWPFEQVFAACHAYFCLARFERDSNGLPIGPDSLLPMAEKRAAEIAEWLREHELHLLPDARTMLRGLLESPGSGASRIPPRSMPLADSYAVNPDVRSSGLLPTGRTVVGLPGSPPHLFWLAKDSSAVLDLLVRQTGGCSVEECTTAVRALWDVEEHEARERLTTALADLAHHDLIITTAPA